MAITSNAVNPGNDPSQPIPDLDYAHELISSRRVEGTNVFDADGKKLGTVHSVMINKRSGQVAYA